MKKERICTAIIFIMIFLIAGFMGAVETDRLTLTAGSLLSGACVAVMVLCGRIIQVEYKRKWMKV